MGPGYGFPSSHSQWMGYFAAFLLCHLALRHRFASTGSRALDTARTLAVCGGVAAWAGAVAYSRYALTYHSARQVLWGVAIGLACGAAWYALVEVLPAARPRSLVGRLRTALLAHPLLAWFRLRDGWAVYPDGGTEAQWLAWRAKWDALQRADASSPAKKTR